MEPWFPANQALRRWREEGQKIKARLGYMRLEGKRGGMRFWGFRWALALRLMP